MSKYLNSTARPRRWRCRLRPHCLTTQSHPGCKGIVQVVSTLVHNGAQLAVQVLLFDQASVRDPSLGEASDEDVLIVLVHFRPNQSTICW